MSFQTDKQKHADGGDVDEGEKVKVAKVVVLLISLVIAKEYIYNVHNIHLRSHLLHQLHPDGRECTYILQYAPIIYGSRRGDVYIEN